MCQLDAGVGDQATPVARMVTAGTCFDAEVEIEAAARAEKDRRTLGAQAQAVGCHQQVGREPFAVFAAQFAQACRAGFLTHLDQVLGIEAQAATLRQHVGHRLHVDRVLALVVGDAAAVPAPVKLGELPG